MAKMITFHSYKGGAGRSSTAFNTIPYLVEELEADAKNPILLLDFDIDSAGMTYLLDKAEYFAHPAHDDVKKFLKNEFTWSKNYASNFQTHSLLSRFVPVGEAFGVENGAVLFFGVDDNEKLDNTEIDGTSEELLLKLEQFAEYNDRIKAIVFDSASGEQTVANFAIKGSKTLVCCMRPTMQFRKGTFRFLDRLKGKHMERNVVLLPTVVPPEEMDIKIKGIWQRKAALYKIQESASNYKNSCLSIDRTFIQEDCFGINEVQRFKWQEGVLYKLEKENVLEAEDEKTATKRYKKLAQVLAKLD